MICLLLIADWLQPTNVPFHEPLTRNFLFLTCPLPESLVFLPHRVNRKSSWPLWGESAASFGRSAELLCGVSRQPSATHLAALRKLVHGATRADKYHRVQVGPYTDTQSAINARHDLEAKDFKSMSSR